MWKVSQRDVMRERRKDMQFTGILCVLVWVLMCVCVCVSLCICVGEMVEMGKVLTG